MEEPIERINNLSRYNLKILNTNDLNFFIKVLGSWFMLFAFFLIP